MVDSFISVERLRCSREMVSKLMKDLEIGGYVGKRDRRVVLLKNLPARR